jgi:hypothetical protein
MNSLNEIIHENIDHRFGKVEYLGQQAIVMTANGYINMTKVCEKHGKALFHWNEIKSSKELTKCLSDVSGIPEDKLTVVVKGGKPSDADFRGTYVHPRLALHIACWISPRVGITVSDIINEHYVT